jgi:hypothetical protein
MQGDQPRPRPDRQAAHRLRCSLRWDRQRPAPERDCRPQAVVREAAVAGPGTGRRDAAAAWLAAGPAGVLRGPALRQSAAAEPGAAHRAPRTDTRAGPPRPARSDAFFPRSNSCSLLFLPFPGHCFNCWSPLAGPRCQFPMSIPDVDPRRLFALSVPVIGCGERFHLVQQLRVAVQRLQIVHNGCLRGRLGGFIPVGQVQIGSAANQQHNR